MIWGPWRTDKNVTLGDYVQVEGLTVVDNSLRRQEGIVVEVGPWGFNLNRRYAEGALIFLRWRLGKLPEVKAKKTRVLETTK